MSKRINYIKSINNFTNEGKKFYFPDNMENACMSRVHQCQEIGSITQKYLNDIKWPYLGNSRKVRNLILSGTVGTGKTYLASAIVNYLDDNLDHFYKKPTPYIDNFLFVGFYSEDVLLHNTKLGWDTPGQSAMYSLSTMSEVPIVVLDDLGKNYNPESQKNYYTPRDIEYLNCFFNIRFEKSLPTILTTNRSEEEIEFIFGRHTASRLFTEESVIVNFNGEDRRKDSKDIPKTMI